MTRIPCGGHTRSRVRIARLLREQELPPSWVTAAVIVRLLHVDAVSGRPGESNTFVVFGGGVTNSLSDERAGRLSVRMCRGVVCGMSLLLRRSNRRLRIHGRRVNAHTLAFPGAPPPRVATAARAPRPPSSASGPRPATPVDGVVSCSFGRAAANPSQLDRVRGNSGTSHGPKRIPSWHHWDMADLRSVWEAFWPPRREDAFDESCR